MNLDNTVIAGRRRHGTDPRTVELDPLCGTDPRFSISLTLLRLHAVETRMRFGGVAAFEPLAGLVFFRESCFPGKAGGFFRNALRLK